MDIANTSPAPPQAITRRSRRLSAIWLIPLLAVAIAGWLVWDTISKEGPTIEVSFDSAEGLQAGKSPLKFKDIEFGTVKSLRLSADNAHVLVTIATNAQAAPLLTEGAAFWVVKPRFFAGNISGLDTLLSGSYVGILPAASRGKKQTTFKGQENPPLARSQCSGAQIPVEVEADRFDLGRLADLFPRSGGRRGARLGHYRHGGKRDDSCFHSRAV